MFSISKLDHVSVIVADTEKSLQFYQGVLGLEVSDQRPELGYPGAWLQVGLQQIHLLQLPNPDPVDARPQHGGRDRHFALRVAEFESCRSHLEEHKIGYTLSRSGRQALFCRDPDGNAIEIIADK